MSNLPYFVKNDSDEISGDIKSIIQKGYTSGVDKIKSYGVLENGNIVGEFLGGGQTFFYTIDPYGNLTYRVARMAGEKKDSRFDAKVKVGQKAAANKSGRSVTCTPGFTFPCGKSCRREGLLCRITGETTSKEQTKSIREKIAVKQGKKGKLSVPKEYSKFYKNVGDFDQWAKEKGEYMGTKRNYKTAVSSAITSGFAVPEEIVKSLKFPQKTIRENQQNIEATIKNKKRAPMFGR